MSTYTALIVGGTSGIGLASARQLVSRGASVHIAGRNKQRIDEVAISDPAVVAHPVDATNADEVTAVAESIGTIDWLIITMSGGEGIGPIAELDLSILRRAFDAKFWGYITTIQAARPYLGPAGSITLVSAITARASMPGTAGIAAINGAVEALVKPLAVELAPIRVNAVSPGFVDTPWWSGMPSDTKGAYFERAAAALPAGQIASAEDIAEAVVLAATNPNVTGTVIATDGGARLVSLP